MRTTSTAQCLVDVWGEPSSHIQFEEQAYLASDRAWLGWINAWPDAHDTGWIVGHNPGLSELVERLTDQPIWLPTSGLAEITLHVDGLGGGVCRHRPFARIVHPQIGDETMSRLRWEWWIAAALLVAFMWRFSALTLYFLAAVALSFVGKPIVNGVARRRVGGRQLGTNLGAVVALTLIVLFSAGVLMLFAPSCKSKFRRWGNSTLRN